MQVVAVAKNLNVSPRKVRVLANVFRRENAEVALARLERAERAAAKPLMKVIKSALANARHAHNLDTSKMMIANIIVNQGLALKRFRPVARGSAHGYRKRRSHVKVVLEG